MYRSLISAAYVALLLTPFAASANNARTSGPAAIAPRAQTGTVVFFREKKFTSAAIRYKVRENGVELCKLASGTYCKVEVTPGKHQYDVHSEAQDVLTLEVDSGETYYVIGGVSMGFMPGHSRLLPSTKEVFEGMKDKLKDNTGKDIGDPDDK